MTDENRIPRFLQAFIDPDDETIQWDWMNEEKTKIYVIIDIEGLELPEIFILTIQEGKVVPT